MVMVDQVHYQQRFKSSGRTSQDVVVVDGVGVGIGLDSAREVDERMDERPAVRAEQVGLRVEVVMVMVVDDVGWWVEVVKSEEKFLSFNSPSVMLR